MEIINKDRYWAHWSKIKSFLMRYSWLVNDALRGKKKVVSIIVIVSMLGAAAQGSIIVFLSFIIDFFQTEKKTGIQLVDNIIGNNFIGLFLMGSVLLILLIISTIAPYFVAVRSRLLASGYHKKSSLRVLKRFNQIRFFDPVIFHYSQSNMQKLATRGSLLSGKAIENVVGSIQSFLYLIGAVAVISILNIKLSLMILPLFVFLLPFIYNLSSNIQTNAKKFYESSVRDKIRLMQKMLSVINRTNINPENIDQYINKQYHESEEIHTFYEVHSKLLLGKDKTLLITSSFKSFLLVSVLFILGYSALNNTLSWGIVMAFVLALLQVSNHLQRLAGNLARLNKYYPIVSNYVDFCNITGRFLRSNSKRSETFPDEIVLAGDSKLGGGKYKIAIKPGDRIIYISNCSPNRLEFSSLITPLIKSSSAPKSCWYNSCFISFQSGYFPTTILDNIAGKDINGKNQERTKQIFKDLGLFGEVETLPEGMDTTIVDEVWKDLSKEARMAIKILPLLFSDSKINFVDLNIIKHVDPQFCLKLFDYFSDRILLFTTEQISFNRQIADSVIVTNGLGIIGIGNMEWFRTVEPGLKEMISNTKEEDTLIEEEVLDDEDF